jgi:hypothetical protein
MLSNYFYLPELSLCMLFYIVTGILWRKYAPSPGKISVIKPYFYYMYYTNLVSFIHCILGIILPAIVFYFYGFEMNRKALYVHHLIMSNSTAYFIYDFIMEKYYAILDYATALHHVWVFLLGAYYFWNPYGGDEYIMTLFLGELANPCLILRTILKSMGKGTGKLFTWIEAVFAVMFVTIRAFVAPIWIEIWLRAENCPFECKLGIAVVFIISMSWNAKILGIFIKRYKEIIGKPPKFLRDLEKFFEDIDKGGIEYYQFYGILVTYSIIYPAVYFGMIKKTLFLSY